MKTTEEIGEIQDKIIEEVVDAAEPENAGENRNPDGTFKKGFSGKPNGRPKGSGMTLKEWVSRKLKDMTDEEKLDFIKDIPKDMQWRMAEGNPKQDTACNQRRRKDNTSLQWTITTRTHRQPRGYSA